MNKLLLTVLASLLLVVNGNNERENEKINTLRFHQSQPKVHQEQAEESFSRENSETGEREKRMSDNGSFGYSWNIGSGVSYLKMHVPNSSGSSRSNGMTAAKDQVKDTLLEGSFKGQPQKFNLGEMNAEEAKKILATGKNKISGSNLGHIDENFLKLLRYNTGQLENYERDPKLSRSGIHGLTEDKIGHDGLKLYGKFGADNRGFAQVQQVIHADGLDYGSHFLRLINPSQANFQGLTNNDRGNTKHFDESDAKTYQSKESWQKKSKNLGSETSIYGHDHLLKVLNLYKQSFPISSENNENREYSFTKNPYNYDTLTSEHHKIEKNKNFGNHGEEKNIDAKFLGGLFNIYNNEGHQNFGNYKRIIADNHATLKNASPYIKDEKIIEAAKKEVRNSIDNKNASEYDIGRYRITASSSGKTDFKERGNAGLYKNMKKHTRQPLDNGINSPKKNRESIKDSFPKINLGNDNVFGKQSTADQSETLKQIEYSNIGGYNDGRFAGAGIYDVLDGNENHQLSMPGLSFNGKSALEKDKYYNATNGKKNINTLVGEDYRLKEAETSINEGKLKEIHNGGDTGLSYSGTSFGNLHGKKNIHEHLRNGYKEIGAIPHFGDHTFSDFKNSKIHKTETDNEWSPLFFPIVDKKQNLNKLHSHKEEQRNDYNQAIHKQNDDSKGRITKSIELTEGGHSTEQTGMEYLTASGTSAKQALENEDDTEGKHLEDSEEKGSKHEDIGHSQYLSYSHMKEPEVHEVTKTIPVQKEIKIPVPHPVRQPFFIPVPVRIMEPYPIQIPVPVAVEKTVEVPVEKIVPYPVEKLVPMKVYKKVSVPVPKPYPVKVPVYKIKYVLHTKKE